MSAGNRCNEVDKSFDEEFQVDVGKAGGTHDKLCIVDVGNLRLSVSGQYPQFQE